MRLANFLGPRSIFNHSKSRRPEYPMSFRLPRLIRPNLAQIALKTNFTSGARHLSVSPALWQGTKPPPDHEYQAQHVEKQPADLSQSYHGISQQPFPKEVTEVLLGDLDPADVEVLPGVFRLSLV